MTNASNLVNKHTTTSEFVEKGHPLTNYEDINSIKQLRISGIEVIGNIPWGTHFCQFYQTKQDLLDVLVPYFKHGLESNELCIWVTSDFLDWEEALIALKKTVPNFTDYIQKGQIEIFPYTDWYVKEGRFESEQVLNQWVTKHNEAINKGYDGLRVSGNPIWIDNMKDWDDFTAYEAEINNVIDDYNIIVLCTYSLEKCDANKVIDVVTNHQFALIKRTGHWKLIESTVHKKTVKTLLENKDRYRHTLDDMQEGYLLIGFNWKYLFVNNTAAKHACKSKEELLDHTVMETFAGIEETELFSRLRQCMNERIPQKFENEFIYPDGSVSWFDLKIEPVPEGIIILSTDITEYKKREQLLSHQAYLINNVSDAVIAIDKYFFITFWNKAAEKIYGWKAEEAIGKTGPELLRTELIDTSREQAFKLVEEQGSYKLDIIHYHKDGRAINIESFFSTIRDEQGQVTEYVSVNRDITERTKLEKEIKTLAKFPAENPNPVMRIGYDGKILYANEASNEILQTWNSSAGDRIPQIWLNEIRASFVNSTQKIMTVESAQKVFSFVIAAVGEENYANLYGRDTTEAKRFEEALRQSEQNFRNILDATQESIYLFDKEYHIVAANTMAIQRLNVPLEEVVGHHFSAFMSPELASYRQKKLDIVFTTGKPVHFEDERNGIYFEHHFFPCINEGQVMYVASYSRDITEKKKIEEALVESEEKYRELVENANTIILKLDTSGKFTYFNEYGQKFFGFEEKEIIGKTPFETIVPVIETTGRDLREMMDNIYEDPDKFVININENVKKNGELVWIEWHNKSLFDKKGNRLGHLAIGTDITERINAVSALQKNNLRLGLLSDITSKLLASNSPQNIVNELCNKVMLFLDCHTFFNFIVDNNAGKLHLNAFAGIPDETAKSIEWLDFGVAVCGCVALDGARIIAENIPDTPDVRTELVRSFGVKAYACHPLLAQGKVIGTLSFGTKSRTHFSDEDIALMKAVADQVAIAMSRIIAEKELHDTKNYLENLIDYANAPIIVWNPASEIQLFNRAFERLTGYSSAEVLGKKIDILFPEETLEDAKEKIKQSLLTNLEVVEIPIRSKNNEIKTFLWNSANIYDIGHQSLISTIAQGHDITIRKKVLKELEESQEKLNLALENGSIGVWTWDIATNEIEWDERMERIFGHQPGSFGKNYDAFEACLVDEDVMHVRNAIKRALEEDVPFETVYRIRLEDGDIKHINAKALVTKDNEGEPIKMTGVCFDITEMKRGAEKALFKTNEDLLRSNKELEQFAYVASHDLQEPLRMVASFTQLLSKRYKDKLDKDANDFIQFAVDGALRMQTLINDLLTYSRVNTRGKDFTHFDMHAVLGLAVYNLQMDIKEKNALITNDELPVIKADESQMVQLLQNLLGNAIKFCDGLPKIHISAKEDKDCFVFSVRDNGIGIEAEYFDRIFQIFQRLQPRETYVGTGIGLAICKRIIDRHGGKIWLESEINKGTTFYFQIPKN